MKADFGHAETQRFLKMASMDQVKWLSCLLGELTICDQVSQFQMRILLGKFDRMPDDELFKRLKVAFSSLKINEEFVFERISRLTSRQAH